MVVIGAGRPDEVPPSPAGLRRGGAPMSAARWCSASGRNALPRAAAAFPAHRRADRRSMRRSRWSSRPAPRPSCCCGSAASACGRASRRTSGRRPASAAPFALDTRRICLFDPADGAADRMTQTSYAGLAGRVVLITGGASGIGAAFVRAFAANRRASPSSTSMPMPAQALVREVDRRRRRRAAVRAVRPPRHRRAARRDRAGPRARSAMPRCWSTTPPTTSARCCPR